MLEELTRDFFPAIHAKVTGSRNGSVSHKDRLSEQLRVTVARRSTPPPQLADQGMSLALFAPRWLVPLFLNTLPGHVCARVWDVFLFVGKVGTMWHIRISSRNH